MEENEELKKLKQQINELLPEGYRADIKIKKNMTPHKRYLKMKKQMFWEYEEKFTKLLTGGKDMDHIAYDLLDDCSNWFIKECFEIRNITELSENEVDKAIELYKEYADFILKKREETLEWKKTMN